MKIIFILLKYSILCQFQLDLNPESSNDEVLLLSYKIIDEDFSYLTDFINECKDKINLFIETENEEIKEKIRFLKLLLDFKYCNFKFKFYKYNNELATPTEFFNPNLDIRILIKKIQERCIQENIFEIVYPKLDALMKIYTILELDFDSLLKYLKILHKNFSKVGLKKSKNWDINVIFLVSNLTNHFKKVENGRLELLNQLKTIKACIFFLLDLSNTPVCCYNRLVSRKIPVKEIIEEYIGDIIKEAKNCIKVLETISSHVNEITLKEVFNEIDIYGLLDLILFVEVFLHKIHMFRYIFLQRMNFLNKRSGNIVEKDIFEIFSLSLSKLHDLMIKVERLFNQSTREEIFSKIFESIESKKFNIYSYFEYKIKKNLVDFRKKNKKDFLNLIKDYCGITIKESKILRKKMLSYRFKFTKLKPKDLTYLSIQSFLLALDFASFLKGIRKMLDGFSLTLLKSMNNSGKFPFIQKSEKRIKALLQKTKIYPIGFLYHDWSNEGYHLDIYD